MLKRAWPHLESRARELNVPRRLTLRAALLIAVIGLTFAESLGSANAQVGDATTLGGQEAEPLSEDARFVEGLRQRRLFRPAESFCEKKLAGQLPPVERADLLIELLRCYAQHALNSPPAKRPPLWRQAAQAAEEFKRRQSSNPKLFLVEFQQGMGALAQGRLARQEAEVGGAPEAAMVAARDQTRVAIRQFEALLNRLQTAIPAARRGRLNEGELTANQLFALQNDVLLQLGRAYENQALCYPDRSDDRLAALTSALEFLAEPIKQLPTGEPMLDDVRLQQARCLRLRGDFTQAERLLNAILANRSALRPQRNGAAAELARIRLAARRPNEALKILAPIKDDDPQVEFARLEALATMIKAAGDDQQNNTIRQQAVALVERIEERHGPYWGRRSTQILVRVAGDAKGGAGLEILRRTAETLYLKGQLSEALDAYDKAAERAAAIGEVEAAFANRITAALIEQKRENMNAYLKRMRGAALEFSGYEKSADAHLGAIRASIQLARQDPKQLRLYEELLLEHVDRWPTSDSANQVRMWIGKMRAAQRKWTEAIEAYGAIPNTSSYFGSAVRAIAPCYRAHLDQLQQAGAATDELADRAARFFESLVVDQTGMFPETWSELDRVAVLTAAQLRLRYRQSDFAIAERMLKAGLSTAADDPAWTRAGRAYLVVALAGQGRAQEAGQLINSLAKAEPEDLYQVVTQLNDIAKTSPSSAANLVTVQRNALGLLRPSLPRLTPNQRLTIQLIEGQTLLQTGKVEEAQSVLAQLAKANPRHGMVQLAYAEALSALNRTNKEATAQWRIVAARSKKESARWYRAKYEIALLLFNQGSKKDAANRIRYLQQTSKMDTPLKAKFEVLLKKCRQ